jgi:hypothetical protein
MANQADDLLAELDQLGSEEQPAPSTTKSSTKATAKVPIVKTEGDDNPFDALEKELAAKPASSSRPTTPRLSSSTTSGGTNKSPKRAEHTPASSGPPSGRTSEDRLRNAPAAARTSGEGRSYHQSFTPGEEAQQQSQDEKVAEQKSGGGWWGSMFSAATGAASAAVKQAESLAKEIQNNEEAMKWAEQVKGYGAGLQSLSKPSIQTRWYGRLADVLPQVRIYAHEHYRRSHLLYRTLRRRYQRMSDCRFTLLTTFSITRHWTHSSTLHSRASCRRSKAAIS